MHTNLLLYFVKMDTGSSIATNSNTETYVNLNIYSS